MAPASPRSDALRVFAIAWAIAVLFDFGSIHRWDRSVYDFALLVATFATLFRGGAVIPLVCMAGLQVITVAGRAPVVSNHWFFMGLVNIGLVVAYLLLALRARRWHVDENDLMRWFAPAGRVGLVVLYFYVVFHKLNPDFMNPDVSAGALFWTAQKEVLPFLPVDHRGVMFGLYTTIIAEAAIPIFLCFGRTRWLGLLIGLVFHFFVGLSPLGRFWDFSSPIYAMYALFLPEGVLSSWREMLARWREHPLFVRLSSVAFEYRLFAIVGAGVLFMVFFISPAARTLNQAPFRYFWMLYGPAFTVFALAGAWWSRERSLAGGFRMVHPLLWASPALVVLNGMNPYLGLKTESSFAMFSNLQTENGRSNHYLIPASLQVFPFQKQCVEILHTTNPRLLSYAEEGRMLTLFELRVIAKHYPGGTAVIRYGEEEYRYENFRSDRDLLQPPNVLLSKYLRFRAFYVDGHSGNWH